MKFNKFYTAKNSLLILLSTISTISFAELPSGLTCNKMPITMDIAESAIEANCLSDEVKTENTGLTEAPENILAKEKFIADDGVEYICSYKNNKLLKCSSVKLNLPQSTNFRNRNSQ